MQMQVSKLIPEIIGKEIEKETQGTFNRACRFR
jgi:hypothetical protein